MANLPTLRSLPEEEVNVVYDGEIGNGKWWVVHILPTGVAYIYRRSSGSSLYQRIADGELALEWSSADMSPGELLNGIVESLDIEGLTARSSPAPVGRVQTLSEITYKVVPVSG